MLFYWLVSSDDNGLKMNGMGLIWRSVNIALGNGLVLSGKNPLPGPMLTHICVAIWRHLGTMC